LWLTASLDGQEAKGDWKPTHLLFFFCDAMDVKGSKIRLSLVIVQLVAAAIKVMSTVTCNLHSKRDSVDGILRPPHMRTYIAAFS
jgi:hypothetical protein